MTRKARSPDNGPADNYKVGYRNPPRHTQFRPGQSGNPKGRPRGTKNLKTDLLEELRESILVREGGQPRKLSKQRAMVKSLMNQTLKGDNKAASLLLSMIMKLLDSGHGSAEQELPLDEDEHKVLDEYVRRQTRLVDGASMTADTDNVDKPT